MEEEQRVRVDLDPVTPDMSVLACHLPLDFSINYIPVLLGRKVCSLDFSLKCDMQEGSPCSRTNTGES